MEPSDGVKYGEEKTCVTLAHGRPTMLLMGINNIKETSAEVQAQVAFKIADMNSTNPEIISEIEKIEAMERSDTTE